MIATTGQALDMIEATRGPEGRETRDIKSLAADVVPLRFFGDRQRQSSIAASHPEETSTAYSVKQNISMKCFATRSSSEGCSRGNSAKRRTDVLSAYPPIRAGV
jgi:hypothetical protein